MNNKPFDIEKTTLDGIVIREQKQANINVVEGLIVEMQKRETIRGRIAAFTKM